MQRALRPKRFHQLWPFYLLAAPGILYFLTFHYIPMTGLILAFKEYSPFKGMMDSPWVGLDNFRQFFGTSDFYMLLKYAADQSAESDHLFSLYHLPVAASE
ncbi:hypothetical protein [Paenibacillus rhizoplanae]|uniref:hypothetical protein n=1 Tax=Paenibacillus rhizoplanae TaxID=1917181 RepID=UPI00361F85CB